MGTRRQHEFLWPWLTATLIFLVWASLTLRPDRDAAQYWAHHGAEIDVSDLVARQAVSHVRLFQAQGLIPNLDDNDP